MPVVNTIERMETNAVAAISPMLRVVKVELPIVLIPLLLSSVGNVNGGVDVYVETLELVVVGSSVTGIFIQL